MGRADVFDANTHCSGMTYKLENIQKSLIIHKEKAKEIKV